MALHRIFGGWRVGFSGLDWYLGLTTWPGGAWMYMIGPFALYHEPPQETPHDRD